MKIIALDTILNNDYFWKYFMSVSFPLAIDTKNDIDLSDFMYENYDYISAQEWTDSFVQFSEDVMEENDGYVENPTAIVLSLNGNEFMIHFHPGDTLYFLNGKEIGSTGAHYKIHNINFNDCLNLIKNLDNAAVALLVMPMAVISDSEKNAAREIIYNAVKSLNFREEDYDILTDMILEGLIA